MTKFQRFLLEYDDERSGGFEPLRHVPADRTVVLGLVTTKKPRLESAKGPYGDKLTVAGHAALRKDYQLTCGRPLRNFKPHRGRRRGTFPWSGSPSAPSAGSPPPKRATCSLRRTRRPNSSL